MKKILAIILTSYALFVGQLESNNACSLRLGCRFNTHVYIDYTFSFYLPAILEDSSIKCELGAENWWHQLSPLNSSCHVANIKEPLILELRFPTDRKYIISNTTNFSAALELFSQFKSIREVQMYEIQGIAIDLESTFRNQIINVNRHGEIRLINFRFDLYTRQERLIETCDGLEMHSVNLKGIKQFFQLISELGFSIIHLIGTRFQRPVCPLVFKNTRVSQILIGPLIDTFYKRNMLKFGNNSLKYNLYSRIDYLTLLKVFDIVLDSKLIDKFIFGKTLVISVYGYVRKIDNQLFEELSDVKAFRMEKDYFKKLIHRQGIEWIKSMNKNVSVDSFDSNAIVNHQEQIFVIELTLTIGGSLAQEIPDRDFCLYLDFPFHQLVFIIPLNPYFYERHSLELTHLTCTFKWLVQHYKHALRFKRLLSYRAKMEYILESSTRIGEKCEWEKLKSKCNKSKFSHSKKFLWTRIEWFYVTMMSRIVLVVLYYLINFLGIFFNSLCVYIILRKKNKDIFSELKQYRYLCSISIFNIFISTIQILSWLTECTDTIDIFCPRTRMHVAVQYLKIIFKECAVTALQFMSNFAYLAFALNRISLIGKNHAKPVTFLSNLNVKIYLAVTGLISVSLSIIKGFRFQVNKDESMSEHPISLEESAWMSYSNGKLAIFISYFLCDLLNHLVFSFVNFGVDVYMLARLRKTLLEKEQRLKEMNSSRPKAIVVQKKKSKKKQNDFKESVKNATKMVLFNSVMNVGFKILICFNSLNNMIIQVYFGKKYSTFRTNVWLETYYVHFRKTGFYDLSATLASFLFTILISLQLFFYLRFDKNMREGFGRIFKRNEGQKSSRLT